MDGLEYTQFASFLTEVQGLVAPEDLGEEMQPYFREQVGLALADIQTLIPWYRSFNVDLIAKADVEEFCSASLFQGPTGKITQLFAYKPGHDCTKYYYKRVSTAAIDCWMEHQRCVCPPKDPASYALYDSPYCNYVVLGQYACDIPYLTATEDDCKFKSLGDDCRIFAVGPDYKIYAAPRFPCDYSLLVQWQGIRRKWSDTALVPVDQQLREAVTNRVEKCMAMKERQWDAAARYGDEYATNLRMLKFRYHDEQDAEMKRDCTAALESSLPAFFPLYAPSSVVPEDCINESLGDGVGDPILENPQNLENN